MPTSSKIQDALKALIAACGYDKSESATEAFYYLLKDAVDNLAGEVEKSHAEGLCMDMETALAHEIHFLLACPKNIDHDSHSN